jgi:hypothetical protein
VALVKYAPKVPAVGAHGHAPESAS